MIRISVVLVFSLTLLVIRENRALNIKVNDITDCNISKSQLQKNFVLSTKLIKNGGNVYLQANATLPQDVDKSYNYTVFMFKWENKAWLLKGSALKGNLCEAMFQYGQPLWKKLSEISKPKISTICPIKAGIYSIDHFAPTKTDLDIPFDVRGRFLIHTEVTKDGIPVTCKLFDIEGF